MFQVIFKWTIIILLTGLCIGAASAFFLWSLAIVTTFSKETPWLLYCLPILGLGITILYKKVNLKLSNGNHFIIESYFDEREDHHKPNIPFALAPLVLFSTLLSHLGGGSVGREGTAVQMGASISSQLNRWMNLNRIEQRLLTTIGISAGFGAVFGTPLAASIFALEFFNFRKTKWFFILPTLLTAYIADFVCVGLGIQHTQFEILHFPEYSLSTSGWIMIAGIIFGVAAFLFIQSGKLFASFFATFKSPFLKPIIGGSIYVLLVLITHQEKMIGLGVDTITDAFIHQQNSYDFLIKILLTSFILSAGFKGGEVTPLFFIGAVLGSALIAYIPLPLSLLAGLGLVAVFAGATHCIFTAIMMGIELFGVGFSYYIVLACAFAFLMSGSKNIYEGRPMGKIKKVTTNYFF